LTALLVVAVLLVAAGYEAAVALEWVSMGSEPGDEAPGEDIARTIGMIALLVGMGYFALQPLRRKVAVSWATVLIPVAAAAFVTTRFYSFDSYYLPTLRRFSEGGSVEEAWVYGLAACALIVAAGIRIWPRRASLAAAVLLLVCVGTVLASSVGH
jgi:hypothetical protein